MRHEDIPQVPGPYRTLAADDASQDCTFVKYDLDVFRIHHYIQDP